MLIAARSGQAVLLLAASVLAAQGALPIGVLCAVAVLFGAGEAMADPAAVAILPDLVRPAVLARANAGLQSGQLLAETFAGRALGGLLLTAAAWIPLGVNAVRVAVAAVLLAAVPRSLRRERKQNGGIRAEMLEGVRFLLASPVLTRTAALVAVWSAVTGAYWSVLPLLLTDRVGLSATGYGLVLAAGGVGPVLGAALAPRLIQVIDAGRALICQVFLSAVALIALSFTTSGPIAAILLAAQGGAVLAWNVLSVSVRQSIVPKPLTGRVTSVYRVAATVTMPIGALVGGLIAGWAGPAAVPAVGGAVVALAGLATIAAGLPRQMDRVWQRQTESIARSREVDSRA